jgi:23S rRNA-/tRNA-specific pseudouridylate synthase
MAVVRHGGRPAKTLYRVEERYRDFTLVRLLPKTGKTHQIRVHMAHLGHPLAIDPLYHAGRNKDGLLLSRFKRGYRPARGDGGGGDQAERPTDRPPPAARRAAGVHVPAGERVDLHAPLPKDFRAVVNMLGRHGR